MSGLSTTTDGDERDLGDIEREICTLAAHIAAATARFLTLLDTFDRRGGWAGAGVLSCAHWLSWKCGMSMRTARDHVRVARRMAALPVTREAFTCGALSYSKVRAITRVATPGTEKDLVDSARSATASQLDRLVRGLRALPDPDDDHTVRPRPPRLSHRWDEATGELLVHGRFTADEGAIILAALTRAEHERRRTAGEEPDLTGPAPTDGRHAMVAVAETMLSVADAPENSPAAEISFVVDHHGAHVEDGPAIDDAAAEAILCGGRGRRVDTIRGRVLRFGRRRRLPSPAQLRALHLRDGACRNPSCGRTRFLHAHHVQPWSRGGRTDLDNLIELCSTCHRALHEGEFGIHALGGQRFTFTGPDEHAIINAPPMHGSVEGILDDSIAADALTPDWDGTGLNLGYAVSVLADAWESDRRQAA